MDFNMDEGTLEDRYAATNVQMTVWLTEGKLRVDGRRSERDTDRAAHPDPFVLFHLRLTSRDQGAPV